MHALPLSLYIHIPFCARKCPYCDFYSTETKQIPEKYYIETLLEDLRNDLHYVQDRPLTSIFIGGGTPSLLSAHSIDLLLNEIEKIISFKSNIEITIEANPGTAEQQKFSDFYRTGINRLSIGVQSFQNEKLKALGRIHHADEAKRAIELARLAGFKNINIDLMHGLPNQAIEDAQYDLRTALQFSTEHLSWYQLTLEPNTPFALHPPACPAEEILWEIQEAGEQLLSGYEHYETSAYCLPGYACRHNMNYWQFGDYLGIGAGAHGKTTDATSKITRYEKTKNLDHYFEHQFVEKSYSPQNLPLEFMMNALRLTNGVPLNLFSERTGMAISDINTLLEIAKNREFIKIDHNRLQPTLLGQRFLNDCLELFI